MENILEGKVAIVTGASRGIGKAVAELFAASGAAVILTARGKAALDKVVEQINEAGGKVVGVAVDAASVEGCELVFDTAIEHFGQVDIVVNNAGIGDMSPIFDTSDAHWNNIMDVNLNGVFRYCRKAVQHFMANGEKGSIVNVSSTNGLRPLCGCAYSVSKAAVNALTENIAIRFANTGIRCNTVCPGVTKTSMAESGESGEMAPGPSMLEYAAARFPITMEGCETEQQAQAVLFLASDAASGLNGATIAVDKGSYI